MSEGRLNGNAGPLFSKGSLTRPWLQRLLRPWQRQPTILLVDDNREVRELLTELLNHKHYRVHTGSNGVECLELARTLRPDLIMLNYLMPRMDGLTALRRLKRDPILSSLKVVMFSGVPDFDQFQEEALEDGALDCLQSPLDLETILATADWALRR